LPLVLPLAPSLKDGALMDQNLHISQSLNGFLQRGAAAYSVSSAGSEALDIYIYIGIIRCPKNRHGDRFSGKDHLLNAIARNPGADKMARKKKARGTENVLADLGFPDTEELTAKTILAKKINDILEFRGVNQLAAAQLLAMPQPKISAIHNYKLRGISLERLMQALTALGQHVEIVVTPSSRKAPARIDVAA
jgi:predicted XRE-type DNA-binding protein